MTTKIKMKKGYPTSDGVMHEKHADAISSQCGINFDNMMKSKGFSDDDLKIFKELNRDDMQIVSDYIKYCRKPISASKSSPKKKSTVKK